MRPITVKWSAMPGMQLFENKLDVTRVYVNCEQNKQSFRQFALLSFEFPRHLQIFQESECRRVGRESHVSPQLGSLYLRFRHLPPPSTIRSHLEQFVRIECVASRTESRTVSARPSLSGLCRTPNRIYIQITRRVKCCKSVDRHQRLHHVRGVAVLDTVRFFHSDKCKCRADSCSNKCAKRFKRERFLKAHTFALEITE